MAYDKTREACSVVEDIISTKFITLETTLSNKSSALTDLVNELSTKISKEPSIEMTTDANPQAPIQAPSNLFVESIATMTASLMSEEKEKEKRKLNIIIHNFAESTLEEAQAGNKMILKTSILYLLNILVFLHL